MIELTGTVRIGVAPAKRFGGAVDMLRVLAWDVGGAAQAVYSSVQLTPFYSGDFSLATTGSKALRAGAQEMTAERTGKLGGHANLVSNCEFVHVENFTPDEAWLLKNTVALQMVAGALTRVSNGVFSQNPPDIDGDAAFADAITDG